MSFTRASVQAPGSGDTLHLASDQASNTALHALSQSRHSKSLTDDEVSVGCHALGELLLDAL